MREKSEDSFECRNGNREGMLGPSHKTPGKCNKILKMFRSIRKENAKNQGSDSGGKEKKGKSWDLEDRKELLKKNMENSWTELPNTLQRKKEKISEEILSEFHDSDSNGSDKTHFSPFRKKSKEKSYDLRDEGENQNRGFFRQKREDELDAVPVAHPGEKAAGSPTPRKFTDPKKKISESEMSCKGPGEASPEKDEDGDDKRGSDGRDAKDDGYCPQTAVDEINLLFHDLIAESGGQMTDSGTDSDFGNSDTYVNVVPEETPTENPAAGEVSPEAGKVGIMRRCDSSDSLLNGSSASVSSASELSQQETAPGKVCNGRTSDFRGENEGNSFEQDAEVTYVDETNEARPKWKNAGERKTCCEETAKPTAQVGEDKMEGGRSGRGRETTQYSNIIFSLPANPRGFFVNEDFKGDLSVDSPTERNPKDPKPPDRGIIYQELDFAKSFDKPSKSEKEPAEDEGKEEEIGLEGIGVPNSNQITSSGLSEEEKAKKKSAEAIAKELSSQIFSKRNRKAENLSGHKIFIAASVADKGGEGGERDERSGGPAVESADGHPGEGSPGTERAGEETPGSEENRKTGENRSGVDLQYFSVADWRKAVAAGSKRGVAPSAMETIVEEPETDTNTKLTVREILRRFEELGNKHFNDKLCMTDDERTATLKQIHLTLKCLEEKVGNVDIWNESEHQQYLDNAKTADRSSGSWTGRGPSQRIPHSAAPRGHQDNEEVARASVHDGKHSLLQFAIHHFRQSPEKFEMLKTSDGSISGSLKVIESKNKKNKERAKGGGKDSSEWTWKEQVDLVKFAAKPIEQSLLQVDTPELSDLAVECFVCLMRYMGDLPMPTDVSEVKCVYTILMHCHKFEQLRDEVYCQLMKQTTNNKSIQQESCQRGWRLFSIVAAYFVSSDTLKPFLFKYLETAAYDKRRAYHGTAMVCLQNLRKTFKYGGRKNVPSVEEITAISAGRNSKRQIYRLPGGTEKVVNTKSTTVVQDVIEELCVMINVTNPHEMEEFSVYCIVEGDTFTMPLAREEYILDVTTELHKNHQVFYLIFCRSVWYFPLRLDSQLYVEVVFNQIAPDYLEGLLLIMPGESLEQEVIYDISKIAALLHRAADMTQVPSMKETKFLLPKPALSVRDVKPSQWVNMVQSNWQDCESLTAIQAKAQVLDVLSKWPLFGSSFFAVKKASEPKERTDHILALNRNGVHFIDLITHETLLHYPFSEVISTRKVKSEDGTLFLDMKCGNLMQQRITRLQTDQAHEISRLIRQYITMQQRMGADQM